MHDELGSCTYVAYVFGARSCTIHVIMNAETAAVPGAGHHVQIRRGDEHASTTSMESCSHHQEQQGSTRLIRQQMADGRRGESLRTSTRR